MQRVSHGGGAGGRGGGAAPAAPAGQALCRRRVARRAVGQAAGRLGALQPLQSLAHIRTDRYLHDVQPPAPRLTQLILPACRYHGCACSEIGFIAFESSCKLHREHKGCVAAAVRGVASVLPARRFPTLDIRPWRAQAAVRSRGMARTALVGALALLLAAAAAEAKWSPLSVLTVPLAAGASDSGDVCSSSSERRCRLRVGLGEGVGPGEGAPAQRAARRRHVPGPQHTRQPPAPRATPVPTSPRRWRPIPTIPLRSTPAPGRAVHQALRRKGQRLQPLRGSVQERRRQQHVEQHELVQNQQGARRGYAAAGHGCRMPILSCTRQAEKALD